MFESHRTLPPGLHTHRKPDDVLEYGFLVVHMMGSTPHLLRCASTERSARNVLRNHQHPNPATPFDLAIWDVFHGRYVKL